MTTTERRNLIILAVQFQFQCFWTALLTAFCIWCLLPVPLLLQSYGQIVSILQSCSELDTHSEWKVKECTIRLVGKKTGIVPPVSSFAKAWAVYWCKCRPFKAICLWVEIFLLLTFREDTVPELQLGSRSLHLSLVIKLKAKFSRKWKKSQTYQPKEDAEQLNYISVGHGIKPTHKSVQSCNQGRNNDWNIDINVNDHTYRGTYGKKTTPQKQQYVSVCHTVRRNWIPFSKPLMKLLHSTGLSTDSQSTLVDNWPPAILHTVVTDLWAQQTAKFSSSPLPN